MKLFMFLENFSNLEMLYSESLVGKECCILKHFFVVLSC